MAKNPLLLRMGHQHRVKEILVMARRRNSIDLPLRE
jgi:hypothetical protein